MLRLNIMEKQPSDSLYKLSWIQTNSIDLQSRHVYNKVPNNRLCTPYFYDQLKPSVTFDGQLEDGLAAIVEQMSEEILENMKQYFSSSNQNRLSQKPSIEICSTKDRWPKDELAEVMLTKEFLVEDKYPLVNETKVDSQDQFLLPRSSSATSQEFVLAKVV